MEKINKYLTEAMGLCWHSAPHMLNGYCEKCGKGAAYLNFSTWQGFGTLWEWAIKQEWWEGFMGYSHGKNNIVSTTQIGVWLLKFINPEKFANAIYGFLKERHNDH